MCIRDSKNALAQNKDDIACIILEPIQGEGGDNHFRKEFFQKLRQLCDENEMLLIMDEVQTGIAMTGKWWAHMHYVQPDVISFGKKTQVCGCLLYTSAKNSSVINSQSFPHRITALNRAVEH